MLSLCLITSINLWQYSISFSNDVSVFFWGSCSFILSFISYTAWHNFFDCSCNTCWGVLELYRDFVWVASTIILFDCIMFFSIAIVTVLEISISKRFISFNRNLRNLVNELGLMTLSSGAISQKYLKDISYLERSTTSTSDKS